MTATRNALSFDDGEGTRDGEAPGDRESAGCGVGESLGMKRTWLLVSELSAAYPWGLTGTSRAYELVVGNGRDDPASRELIINSCLKAATEMFPGPFFELGSQDGAFLA